MKIGSVPTRAREASQAVPVGGVLAQGKGYILQPGSTNFRCRSKQQQQQQQPAESFILKNWDLDEPRETPPPFQTPK